RRTQTRLLSRRAHDQTLQSGLPPLAAKGAFHASVQRGVLKLVALRARRPAFGKMRVELASGLHVELRLHRDRLETSSVEKFEPIPAKLDPVAGARREIGAHLEVAGWETQTAKRQLNVSVLQLQQR